MRVDAYAELVAEALGESATKASKRLKELEKFLYLVSETKEFLQPSKWVDEAWHLILEDDDEYRSFLAKKGLGYVRHIPCPVSVEQYERTRTLLKETFGEVDTNAWPPMSSADCGSCGGGGGTEGDHPIQRAPAIAADCAGCGGGGGD